MPRFHCRRATTPPPLRCRYAFAPTSLYLRSLGTDLNRTYIGRTSDLYRTYTCSGTDRWRRKLDNRPCLRPSVRIRNIFPSPYVIYSRIFPPGSPQTPDGKQRFHSGSGCKDREEPDIFLSHRHLNRDLYLNLCPVMLKE